jgi:hypothetical protein
MWTLGRTLQRDRHKMCFQGAKWTSLYHDRFYPQGRAPHDNGFVSARRRQHKTVKVNGDIYTQARGLRRHTTLAKPPQGGGILSIAEVSL